MIGIDFSKIETKRPNGHDESSGEWSQATLANKFLVEEQPPKEVFTPNLRGH
jgi:hypothetical protein